MDAASHPWVTMVMKCKQSHEYINNGLFTQGIVAWPLNQSDIPIWRITGHKPDVFADDESQISLFHVGVTFNHCNRVFLYSGFSETHTQTIGRIGFVVNFVFPYSLLAPYKFNKCKIRC